VISTSNLFEGKSAYIVGIDLAWGEKLPDGLCLINATRESSEIIGTASTFGDNELLAWLAQHLPTSSHVLLSIDAPLIIPNATGCRPVEKQISREFGRYHAFCHSSNSTNPNCTRPIRVAQLLRENGYTIGFDLNKASRMAIEVYPHPAIVRFFYLDRIIKYKKGIIAVRKSEFTRLQDFLLKYLHESSADIEFSQEIERLLSTEWSKSIEDQTDALVCALIGYIHWKHQGRLSKVVGSIEEGFILLPPRYRNGFILMEGAPVDQVVTMELVNHLRDED
jgi:predicted RNase H-like nuclease